MSDEPLHPGDWGMPLRLEHPIMEHLPDYPWLIVLRDTRDGDSCWAIRDLERNPEYWESDDAMERDFVFWWTDGNGACDCNRSLAMGHGDEILCNTYDPPRYDLVSLWRDGRLIWDERDRLWR